MCFSNIGGLKMPEEKVFELEAMFVQAATSERVMIKYVPTKTKKPTWGNTTQKEKELCAKNYKPNDMVMVSYTQKENEIPFVTKVEKVGGETKNEPVKQEIKKPVKSEVQKSVEEKKETKQKKVMDNVNDKSKLLLPERYLCPPTREVEERIVRTESAVFAGKALEAMAVSGGVNPNSIINDMRRLYKEAYTLLTILDVKKIK